MRAVVDAVSEPVAFFSADQTVVAMNPPFARIAPELFGASLAEGGGLADLPDPDLDAHRRRFWSSVFTRALAGSPLTADLLVETAEGPRCYAISVVPVGDGAPVGMMSVSVRSLESTRDGMHREAMELTLGRLFSDEIPIDASLHSVLEFLCQSDGWDLGIAWLARGEGLEAAAVWHDGRKASADFERAVRELRFEIGQGLPGRTYAEDRVTWVADLLDETGGLRWPFALPLGFRGVVAVPLRGSAGTTGVLELFTRSIRPVNETAVRSLTETGAAIGRLIEHRRAYEERRRLQEELAMRGSEWAQTFDAIELPVFITTADGTIVRANRAARELGGEVPLERRQIGRVDRTELWRTLGDVVRAVVESRAACSAQSVDARGTRHWDLTGSLFAPADREERVILILRDVTTTVTLQESVRRGEQLAAMGELVAGVAHEVRNPLFGMTATLDAYESSVASMPDGAEMIFALRSWIKRLSVL
ncbi:MAG TPA: GAF domain-containing protein, partial [Thermoanaerobaculia bacterium]